MNIWMDAKEELAQGYKGLWAHILVGCLAVTLADRFGGSPHWAAAIVLPLGVAWEVIGYYVTDRRWVASGLGFLAFALGATAGFLICVFS